MIQHEKARVLFVCIGNSCRSQMAEAFARLYGGDAMIAASAGLQPAFSIAPDTVRAMQEKNIDLRDHFPKDIRNLAHIRFEYVVNMSGYPLPKTAGEHLVGWEVADPIGMDYQEHCEIRDLIERLVMNFVLDLRRERATPRFRGQGSGRLKL